MDSSSARRSWRARRLSSSQATAAFTPLLHWLKRPLGRAFVQSLVILLTLTSAPLEPVLRALHWKRSPLGRIAQRLAALSYPSVLAQQAAVVSNPDFADAL